MDSVMCPRHEAQQAVGKGPVIPYPPVVEPARTYRRRRLGALLLTAALAYALGAVGTGAEAEPPSVSYTVASGDTLWSIADERYSPTEDPRVKIEEIRQMNGIEGSRIYPGRRLELPAPPG